MKPVLVEQSTFFEVDIDEAGDNVVTEIDLGTVGAAAEGAANSITLNFTGVTDTDVVNGIFNPRVWVENWPRVETAGFVLGSKLSTVPLSSLVVNPDPATWADATAFAIPYTRQAVTNMAKATYYGTGEFKYLSLRLENTDGVYETRYSKRQDPVLIYEWEKENTQLLTDAMPMPNSDHLWVFSQVDIYVNITVGGTTYRVLLGWCADEDFSFDTSQETVEFRKGKPSSTAVQFMSVTGGMIEGTLATCDPWFLSQLFHITPANADNQLIWTETNKQRPIAINDFELEWNTNSGNKVIFKIPRGQVFQNGAISPGGSDITRMPFRIVPLVNTGTRAVWNFIVTTSVVQQARLPIVFAATA